ncbi:hypothetical protein KP77_05250 [Jeotgalibacillus alimentarius]|uniref:Lipoprotein n=1 Tax=Jeotgalibacillus alimentarius TaxID=135826 RepID=A0A0C2SHY4_9BACL|nr:hypothetical protein [Jeotgalibacillus alimentarius]KIL53549.1 hypothetical protein KP77_05250 [Jeotgalibacillus alimentarius]
MKKLFFAAILMMGISIMLMGCSSNKENDVNWDLEKAQKIDIVSADIAEEVLSTLNHQEEIDKFVNRLEIQEWDNDVLPSDAVKSHTFLMYQEGTVKPGDAAASNNELNKVASITSFEGIPFIEFQTKNMNFIFQIPNDAAEYLWNIEP